MIRTKLKKMRLQKKMTQQEVADFVGIKRATYGMIENNKRDPSFKVAKKIKILFQYENDDLFN